MCQILGINMSSGSNTGHDSNADFPGDHQNRREGCPVKVGLPSVLVKRVVSRSVKCLHRYEVCWCLTNAQWFAIGPGGAFRRVTESPGLSICI